MKKKYCRKALGWSLAVVASISFIAPPLGADSADHALASSASDREDSGSHGGETGTTENTCEELNAGLIGKGTGQAVPYAGSNGTEQKGQAVSISAAGQEGQAGEKNSGVGILETDKTDKEETGAGISLSKLKVMWGLAGELAQAYERTGGELELLEVSWQDELTSSELAQVIKGPKSAEELFYENLDWSSIPEILHVSYNEAYRMALSAEQRKVLETIVEAEAGDEDIFGKMLVANVVLNRVLDKHFPDTVKEVVFQNNGKTYQFSPVRKGGRYYTVKVSDHTREAVERVLNGEDYSEGALYFFARRYTSSQKASWFDNSLRKIVKYGCHEFFKEK